MEQALSRNRARTEARRRVQPLWSALDRVLGPLGPGGLLLCVSGGPDSTALLEAAATWPGRLRFEMEVAAVDHGGRAEARREVDAVVGRARALGFDAAALSAPGRGADEASLRGRRLGSLVAHARARGLSTLVTAHHADDLAEGALMRLVGEARVGAPAPVEPHEELAIARPFLALPRALLLAARAGPAFLDPHDRARQNARAHARAALAPLLDARAPGWRGAAADDARQRARDADLVDAGVRALVDEAALSSSTVEIPLPQPAALVRRLTQRFVGAAGRRARGRALDAVVEAAAAGEPAELPLPAARAKISPGRLRLERVE